MAYDTDLNPLQFWIRALEQYWQINLEFVYSAIEEQIIYFLQLRNIVKVVLIDMRIYMCVCVSSPSNEVSPNTPSLGRGCIILIHKGERPPAKNLNWTIATR